MEITPEAIRAVRRAAGTLMRHYVHRSAVTADRTDLSRPPLLTSAYVCLKRERLVKEKLHKSVEHVLSLPDRSVPCDSTVKPPRSINPSISVRNRTRKPERVLVESTCAFNNAMLS